MFRGRAVVLVLVAAIGGVCGTSIESMSGSITVMVDQGGSLLVQPTGGTPQTVAMAQDVAALSGAVTAVNTSANQVRTYPGPVRSRARDRLRRLGVTVPPPQTRTGPLLFCVADTNKSTKDRNPDRSLTLSVSSNHAHALVLPHRLSQLSLEWSHPSTTR